MLWQGEGAPHRGAHRPTIPPKLAVRSGSPGGPTTRWRSTALRLSPASPPVLRGRAPDPRHARTSAAMHDELEALIRAAGGRTLALFTSWRAMEAAARAMAPPCRGGSFTQAELPKAGADRRPPTDDERACPFATHGLLAGGRTSRGRRCRSSPSTASRSPGPTTHCSRPAATSRPGRLRAGGPARARHPPGPGRGRLIRRPHRPGRRRRARPTAGLGPVPVGARARDAALCGGQRDRSEVEAFLRSLATAEP